MSYAIAKWNKVNIHFIGDLKLLPGVNEVTKEQVEMLHNHFICKAQIEAGDLEILVKESPEQGLGGFKNPEAVKLVGETIDKALLEGWKESEKRPQVLKAITDQLAKIAVEPSQSKEK